jgi:hypothetical protein
MGTMKCGGLIFLGGAARLLQKEKGPDKILVKGP